MEEEKLSFEDGVIFCKHLFQCAIHKTLNGVPEEWDIFYKTHSVLDRLGYDIDNEKLSDILYKLNIIDIYREM